MTLMYCYIGIDVLGPRTIAYHFPTDCFQSPKLLSKVCHMFYSLKINSTDSVVGSDVLAPCGVVFDVVLHLCDHLCSVSLQT